MEAPFLFTVLYTPSILLLLREQNLEALSDLFSMKITDYFLALLKKKSSMVHFSKFLRDYSGHVCIFYCFLFELGEKFATIPSH